MQEYCNHVSKLISISVFNLWTFLFFSFYPWTKPNIEQYTIYVYIIHQKKNPEEKITQKYFKRERERDHTYGEAAKWTVFLWYQLCLTHMTRGGVRNFCLGGPICVANLLVYTNFYIHKQTHVSIHTQKISIFHNESLKLNVS